MYINSKNILTGVLCAIIIAAITMGVLFACGVFGKKDSETATGIKLPIVYPDENINWAQVNDTTLRASFDDKLNIDDSQKYVRIAFYVNDFPQYFCPSLTKDESRSEFFVAYDTWKIMGDGYTQNWYRDQTTGAEMAYRVTLVLYNNATLTETGDVTSGDGFVIEFGDFDKIERNNDTGEETYIPEKIEKIQIVSIYQDSKNSLLA